MIGKKLMPWGLLFLFTALGGGLWGGDERTIPIDVYLIVDSSSAMERGKDAALTWLCTTVIDGMLTGEDRIWIWTAGEKPELIYSGTLGDREGAKAAVRGIRFQGDKADYRGALEAARAILGRGDRTAYTLLVSGSGAKDPPSREAESAGLLRYSRVESFSGWRVLTIGLDLESRIRRSASQYQNAQ
jgi:hypothetical protein